MPIRAALLTGQHPARIGILDYLRPNSSNALPTNLVTLPEVLNDNGYSTGMIGKWHLTGYQHHDAEFEIRPRDHGFTWKFDHFSGSGCVYDLDREVIRTRNMFSILVVPMISNAF